jgi:hypothetical protein
VYVPYLYFSFQLCAMAMGDHTHRTQFCPVSVNGPMLGSSVEPAGKVSMATQGIITVTFCFGSFSYSSLRLVLWP